MRSRGLSQLKHTDAWSGTGGDWAVRVSVSRTDLGRLSAPQRAAADAQRAGRARGPKRRISLLMYIADEGKPTQAWEVSVGGVLGECWESAGRVRARDFPPQSEGAHEGFRLSGGGVGFETCERASVGCSPPQHHDVLSQLRAALHQQSQKAT